MDNAAIIASCFICLAIGFLAAVYVCTEKKPKTPYLKWSQLFIGFPDYDKQDYKEYEQAWQALKDRLHAGEFSEEEMS
jgi:hypothetical protein